MTSTGLRIGKAGGWALLAALAAPAAAQPTVTTRFTPSAAPMPNPERGFYRAAPGDLGDLDSNFLQAAYREGFRLIYARINLDDFRTRPITGAYLDRLEAGFAAARAAGVKLIVRAAYNYPRGETAYRDAQDAALPLVLRHLEQLRPVFAANADVTAFVQAGLIGAWGEWHTSSNALTAPDARTAIKDALLAAVPAERFVQFRYPPHIRDWLPHVPAPGAPAAARLRIGFHNDCFLASRTDVGTFSEEPEARAREQAYVDRLGDIAPFGGETCNPADDPGASPRTACEDILREGARYNLTYLNAGYYRRLFHDSWIADGCHDRVAAKMGYRLQLVDAVHRASAAPGESLGLAFTMRNNGWAKLYNARALQVLLRGPGGRVVRLPASSVDLRSWLPGSTRTVPMGVRLPNGLLSGDYDILIAMPDPAVRLQHDPRYAIRPANLDDRTRRQGWDAALGAYAIGTRVRVEALPATR